MVEKEKIGKKYILQICEPWNFKAPDGSNEFEVMVIGKVEQSDAKFNKVCLLVKSTVPFKFRKKEYRYLILGNRWHGESIKDFIKKKIKDITVYVNRLTNPQVLNTMVFTRHDIDYCAIGTLKRHK